MHCFRCRFKSDWLIDYDIDRVALLCNECASMHKYIDNKIITYKEFINDQYLAEIICRNTRFIYYSINNTYVCIKQHAGVA